MRPIGFAVSLLLISAAIESKTLFFKARDNTICPDKQGSCPESTTCCQLQSGKYGCCPFPNAVCCSDHEHCCPSGLKCDVEHQKCTQSDGKSIDWTSKLEVIPLRNKSDSVICPDQSQCADGQTCCQLVSGDWGCCPYPQAVCCSDHVHCCPNGYTCDVAAQQCLKQNGEFIPWSPKTKATQINRLKSTIICPDQQSQCADGQTCCQLPSGQWGCCPYPQAACCSDHEHCCPNGYICDVPDLQCLKANGEAISWSAKTKAIQILESPHSNIICPDQKSQCADGETCCQLPSGEWGCCPLPQAVCCSDHVHCCPNGYICDVPDLQCLKANGESISWSAKTKAIQIIESPKSGSVICPDQQSQCPDGQTCCQLSSGQYGCCPYPQAVCCSDHDHCCPNGYTCDVAHQQCLKANGLVVSWSSKTKASPIVTISNSVICPDGASMCPDSTTCCQLASGIWACCPLPKAVCCTDHEHCCPNGYTCDLPEQKCNRADGESLPWSTKLQSVQIPEENNEKSVGDIICPDKSSCSAGETCCLVSPSGYGCCPLPQATCCSDYLHCCPHAYSCDIQKQTCIRSDGFEVSWTKKSPPKSSPAEPSLCADQKSKCRDGFTCCDNSARGTRGCCPYENSVCCSDGLHCCPENTVCNAETQMCRSSKINMAISWHALDRLIGLGFTSAKANEKCPDQKSDCPSDTTCCQMQSGLYGCCPFKQALCCEDKLHCCPSGFKCDVEHSRCVVEKSGVALPWEMFGRRRAKISP